MTEWKAPDFWNIYYSLVLNDWEEHQHHQFREHPISRKHRDEDKRHPTDKEELKKWVKRRLVVERL